MVYLLNKFENDSSLHLVEREAKEIGFKLRKTKSGQVLVAPMDGNSCHEMLKDSFSKMGLRLKISRKAQIVKNIKSAVELFLQSRMEGQRDKTLSEFIGGKVNREYKYLSGLFSDHESISIERYLILQRVKVAEKLLFESNLSLDEIADLLDYSSVQHLTSQFKKMTGLTPGKYRKINLRFSN